MPDIPTGPVVPDDDAQPLASSSAGQSVAAADLDPGYSVDGVPTFESVREKIETRYGTSVGAAELDAETPEGRDIEEQYEARQRAAAQRVEQIRESMHRDTH